MARRTALIAGASGLVGRAIAQRLAELGNWDVSGLARTPRSGGGLRWIAVDLTDAADCARRLAQLKSVTHVYYAARYDHAEGTPEPAETNAAMLRNVIDALERNPLEHVHAVHGTKYYGHQLGPVPVPVTEDSPRARGENFYFVQEDFLRERARARGFGYTLARPHTFCTPAPDVARSIGLALAVYAAIARELGQPLDFPGSARAYEARTQFTDLALLARAAVWMANEPRCANQAFNIVNGDYPRWSELWPQFAAALDIVPGAPRAVSLARYMADKRAVWNRLVAKHGLKRTALDAVVLWPYADYVFRPEWDIMSAMTKARALGFDAAVDTGTMFRRQFERYRAEKNIP
jgi:nucleoside-diphosphate-sugar epimerase